MIDAVVVDASVVTAALVQDDEVGAACAQVLLASRVAAPALLPFEVANSVRGVSLARQISDEAAWRALRTALRLPIESHPLIGLAERVWELRSDVSAYDASYVAVAELTGLPLATCDRRLARATGPRCDWIVLG